LLFARTVNSRVSLLRIISGYYPKRIKGMPYGNIVMFWWWHVRDVCTTFRRMMLNTPPRQNRRMDTKLSTELEPTPKVHHGTSQIGQCSSKCKVLYVTQKKIQINLRFQTVL